MGIQGLLPTLKSIMTPVHVRQYAGKKAAIDTYSWLHKAAYTCSKEVCEGRPTDKFVDYCMHRVNLLRHYGVQPVLVFDGGVLPMKADQEAKRARSRKEHLERAREHERVGNQSAAYDSYQKAVDITPALAFRLIRVLKQEGIEYIVAPYEADAQMAYLALCHHVDVIITEDSDLIAYGCPRVLFKMDKSGQGDEFQYIDLVRNKDLNFANFTKQMVLEMCVMTGCDYLPSIPGMGVKKAHTLIRRFKSYQKVIRHLRFSGVTISSTYEELFERAVLTFLHQRVYDPVHQQIVHLTEVPKSLHFDLEFLGPDLPHQLVKGIAEGQVDPSTKLPFEEPRAMLEAALPGFGYKSLDSQNTAKKSQELLAQKNVLTNYFFSESQEAKKQFKAPRSTLCGEREMNSLPAKSTSGAHVPGAEDLTDVLEAHSEPAKVFGTPLPDDDGEEDSESQAFQEAHDNVFGTDHHLKISLRTRVLEGVVARVKQARPSFLFFVVISWLLYITRGTLAGDPCRNFKTHVDICDSVDLDADANLRSSVFQQASSASTAATGRLSLKQRKAKSSSAGPQMKLSGYFSHPRLAQSDPVNPHATDPGIYNRQVLKRSRVEDVLEKVEEDSLIVKSTSPAHLSYITSTERKTTEIIVREKRNQPSPLSKPSGEGSRAEVDKFSCNIAHIDQFSRLAQKSIDRFVEAIAPFRCSLKGTRASGLRAPIKSVSVVKTSTRICGARERTLSQFSCESSSFKPPRLDLNHSRPSLVTTGAVECQDTNAMNWS